MTHRILIADPNKTVRLAAQMVFAKTPEIEIITALNAFEALDKMHLFKPSLVMVDQPIGEQLSANLRRLPCRMVFLNKPFTALGLVDQVRKNLH